MNITIVGTGYVGLVTAALFASFKNKVWALDINEKQIESLKKGKVPFYETGLKKLVLKGIKQRNLHFTTSYEEAMIDTEVIFICVGTPPKEDGDYDLSYVYKASESIAKHLKNYTVIVIKSTVPPGTNDEVRKLIEEKTKMDFDLASCPEFLREGSAVEDSFHPSRVVIGAETRKAIKKLLKLHKQIPGPRVICDMKSAQLIKYAANAFLATKISYINSIAQICDKIGADIKNVSRGLGLDPRIGDKFLEAGLGYGGSCFPKDTWALISFAKRLGYNFDFLKQVDKVNKDQINYFINKVVRLCNGSVKDKKISILGLSFKPNTDDMREARSVLIIDKLQKMGAKIFAYDPVAINKARGILKNVKYGKNVYHILEKSEALLLITEWKEFEDLNFRKIRKLMKKPVVVDGRNIYDPDKLKKLGFEYEGIGRKKL